MPYEDDDLSSGSDEAFHTEASGTRWSSASELLLISPRLVIWPIFFFLLTSVAVGSPLVDLTTPQVDNVAVLGWGELLALLAILGAAGKATGAALDERRSRRIFDAQVDAVGSSIRHMQEGWVTPIVEELRRLTDQAIATNDFPAVALLTEATLALIRTDAERAYEAVAQLRARVR